MTASLLASHDPHITVIIKFIASKAIHIIESIHHLHAATGIIELAVHEELRVLATLGAQFNLTLINRLKARRQLRLRLIPIKGARGVLALILRHTLAGSIGLNLSRAKSGLLLNRAGVAVEFIILSSLAALVERILTYK